MSIIGKNVHVGLREDGSVHLLRHNQHPFTAGAGRRNERSLSRAYLKAAQTDYGFDKATLSVLSEKFSGRLRPEGSRLRLAEVKSILNLRTLAYGQSYLGLPVWESGVAVRVEAAPLRVLSSSSSAPLDIDLRLPKKVAIGPPAAGDNTAKPSEIPAGVRLIPPEFKRTKKDQQVPDLKELKKQIAAADKRARETLRSLAKGAKSELTEVSSSRPLIYLYTPANRFDPNLNPEAEESPPVLAVGSVPKTIEAGKHYLVTEVLFTLDMPSWGKVSWRIFFELFTGAVVYLRAFVHGVDGEIFEMDPIRLTGDATLVSTAATADLDAEVGSVTLPGLDTPAAGDPQLLSGEYIALSDTDAPTIAAPTETLGNDFDYSSADDDFAAVSAYYHLDSLYRMVGELGYNVADYFSGTTFPIPVDHRGEGGGQNAHHHGSSGGTTKYRFGLLSGSNVGYAADRSPVIHEFGHSCLTNNIGSGVFSWAHGIGDSLAMILLDPDSEAPDRFVRSPFFAATSGAASRRCDRDVAAGWAWGGSQEDNSYQSTQILSTSLFRAYRSTGGDEAHSDPATRLARREFAARYLSFLLLGAVGSMSSVSPPTGPDDLATAMIDLDQANSDFEGHPGGAFHKVIRWAFEKQGLYQPAGAPTPVTTAGDPPAVDVYIDDGRAGEYDWRQNFWNTTDLWNRLAADGGLSHETPILEQTNYLYVRVKNRGTTTATNVTLRAYHCIPGAGLTWPDDWQPMDTAELAVADIPSGGEVVVGPFEWTPENEGHECLLASVSADGDPSNADTVLGSIPHWRLVPFDNNLGQRNVAPVPGGGDSDALVASFENRTFTVLNPYDRAVFVELETVIPSALSSRGWKLNYSSPGGARFRLGPLARQEVRMKLLPGAGFRPADLPAEGADLAVEVSVDKRLVGGMTYRVDPKLSKVPPERRSEAGPGKDCKKASRELLDCLGLPSEGVDSACIRKVTVDIRFRSKDCC